MCLRSKAMLLKEKARTELPTGDIEIEVSELRIISKAQTPPFEVSKADEVGDETTLKYRYLALRNEELTKIFSCATKLQRLRANIFTAKTL